MVLLFITIHVIWLCSYVCFGENINCWWNKVQAVSWNVYIECQALPAISMQKCPCDLYLLLEQPVQATLHHCTQVSAHFTTAVELQAMQNASGTLACRGQDPAVCTVKEGYPPPTCSIPLDDGEMNMNCRWPHSPFNPMDFILYLEDMHGNGVGGSPLDMEGNNSVIIQRTEFEAFSNLKAWLSASNALGAMQSDVLTFHTGSIVQLRAPRITHHAYEPLEIMWEAERTADLPAEWLCKVQYHQPCDPEWTEDEANHEANFVLLDPVPFTTYTFRVRCWLISLQKTTVVMSDWSKEYNVNTPPTAPLGKLDVWSICEPSLKAPSCKILWKEMPAVQAQGNISSYMVRVRMHDNTDMSVRVNRTGIATRETCIQCGLVKDGRGAADVISHAPQACEEKESCYLYILLEVPIKEVKDVFVSASTAHGESSPSLVALPRSPRSDVSMPTVKPEVTGVSSELSVLWAVPEWFSNSVQEYVVQHELRNLTHILCLNWVKVHKTQNFITVRGTSLKYTSLNVSLFAIVDNCSYLLGFHIVYNVDRAPRKVKGLRITDISSSSVNLTWTPIPFNESPGPNLHYLVGLDDHSVVNVSRNVSSVQFSDLTPGQHYNVWITAVNEAGTGGNITTSFTTASDNLVFVLVAVTLTILLILFVVLIFKVASSLKASFKLHHRVPDPINSSLFKGNDIQVQAASTQIPCSWHPAHPLVEYDFSNSNVDIVEVSESLSDLEDDGKASAGLLEAEDEEQRPARPEYPEPGAGGGHQGPECGGPERAHSAVLDRRKDYSQVIDSDDEQGSGEDEEWDGQPHPSDYERHFLPCI